MKAPEVVTAVRCYFGAETDSMGPEWAALAEFNLSGLSGQRCDLFLVRAWQGRPKGHERIAVEVKVARGDLVTELRNPAKRAPFASVAHRFYFACPAGLMKPEEVPEDCGLLEVREGRTPGTSVQVVVQAPRTEPADLPQRATVEAFRRAARAEARIRTAEADTDPAATIARLIADADRAHAATQVARTAEDKAKRRSERYLELVLKLIGPDVPIPCECGKGNIRRHGLHWRHDATADPGDRCRYPWPNGFALAERLDSNPDALSRPAPSSEPDA